MNGVFFVDKESGCTSRDIVNEIIKKVETPKVGHTGTLDPMATGVLIVVVGKCTKLINTLTLDEKEYEAEITLGMATDTYDITGEVLKEEEVFVSKEDIIKVLKTFVGSYLQEVPLYSAVKVNGKRLYQYARHHEKVILPKRQVTIKELELIMDPVIINNHETFKIRTVVSKGTYIRSLVNDIAKRLNTIGVMSSLRRTRVGNITIDKCKMIDDITIKDLASASLLLEDLKHVTVDDILKKDILNGKIIDGIYNTNKVVFTDKDGKVLAIYKTYEKDITKMKPDVMLGGI